jgi:hypothetical protein
MTSPYRDMVRILRANLVDEKNFQYILHAPMATINVGRWHYFSPGFVIVEGEDEDKVFRFFVFSEAQIASFPLEVKPRKKKGAKGAVGFTTSSKTDKDDVV